MKSTKKLITRTLIISVAGMALTAFAIKLFVPSNTAYYIDSTGHCVSLTVVNGTPFDVKGAGDTAATVLTKDGLLRPLYTNSTCTTAATFKP